MKRQLAVIVLVCAFLLLAVWVAPSLFYLLNGETERTYIAVVPESGPHGPIRSTPPILGVCVRVDGTVRVRNARGTGIPPMQLSPGEHRIAVTARGYHPKAQTVNLAEKNTEHYV